MARKLIVLGLALGALAAVAGCEVETEEPSIESGGKSRENGKQKPKVAKLGDRVTLKGTTYEVTDVSTAQTLGDASIGTDVEANGTFVIVKLTLTNRKDEPATIIEDNMRLIGGNGKNYSTSDDALLAVDDQFLLEEIQPDNTESGSLVYDVPPAALDGARLRVEDLFSDSTAQIKLGL